MLDNQPFLDRLRDAHTVRVYTPMSRQGIPFRILFVEVVLPMFIIGTCAFTFITGLAIAALADNSNTKAVAGAFALGSLTAGIIGTVQLQRYHEKQFVMKEYDLLPPEEEEPRAIPTNGNGGQRMVTTPRSGKNLAYGNLKFHFTGRNLDELKRRYVSGDKAIRRDTAGELMGLNSLPDPITSARYTAAREVLRGVGYIDERNEWTEEGVVWLKQE